MNTFINFVRSDKNRNLAGQVIGFPLVFSIVIGVLVNLVFPDNIQIITTVYILEFVLLCFSLGVNGIIYIIRKEGIGLIPLRGVKAQIYGALELSLSIIVLVFIIFRTIQGLQIP